MYFPDLYRTNQFDQKSVPNRVVTHPIQVAVYHAMQSAEVNQEADYYHGHNAARNSILAFHRDFSCHISGKFGIHIAVESLRPDDDEICMQGNTDPIRIEPGKKHIEDDQLDRPEKW